jgi:hypothetical protein
MGRLAGDRLVASLELYTGCPAGDRLLVPNRNTERSAGDHFLVSNCTQNVQPMIGGLLPKDDSAF